MIDALIQQLRDRDPVVRRQAIIALGKSKDINALRPLADVFRSDADPELRELARKAGVYIRQQNPNAAPPSPPPSPPPSARPSSPPAGSIRGQVRGSSQSDSSIKRRSLAELAAQVRGDDEASDIQASKRIEEYEQRRQSRIRPVTPIDADEGETPPPRLRGEEARSSGGSLLSGRRSRTEPPSDASDDSDMNFLSDYLNRTAGDDLSAYLDDAPAADEPPKRGRGSSFRRAKEWTLGSASAISPAAGAVDDDEEEVEEEEVRPVSLADYGFVRGKEYRVDKEDKERARKNMDAALTMEERGQNDKALKSLALALKLDPNLINDGFFNSIAASITGKDGDEAIAVLISGEKRSQAMQTSKNEQKSKRVEKHMEKVSESTGTGLAFEMVLFFLINGGGYALAFVIVVQGLVNFATQLVETVAASPQFEQMEDAVARVQDTALALNTFMVVAVLVAALTYAILSVGIQVFQSGVIHGISRLLGGKGRFIYQLTSVTAVYNKYMPFFYVLLCIFSALAFVTPYAIICGSLVLPIFGIFISIKGSQKIGESYAMGTGMGCAAYILSTIIIYVVYALIWAALGGSLDQAMQNMIDSRLEPI